MEKLKILIIEDEPLARKLAAAQLREHDVDFAPDAAAGRRKIADGGHDICFIDLKLDGRDEKAGLALVPLATKAGAYSIVMSGHDSEAVVERAYELGCDDFYAKGNEEENIRAVIERFLRKRRPEGEDRLFQDLFVTEDSTTREAVASVIKYASSDLPVIVLGPTGTGKTSLAEVIHGRSGRRGQFIAINCAAYTEDLLEAELFGYRKGAFTGAADGRKGKLLLADGGTLFLDEIGSMSVKMQTKLLKAIEEKSFYPLGSDRPEKSRFRIVSATLESLPELVKRGTLRFDFLQRVQGLTIELKPLIARKCDVFPLISFFTRGRRRLSFVEDARQELLRYDWPGNVRELKKFVELAAQGESGRIDAKAVRRLLSATRADRASEEFLSDAQYRFIREKGLYAAVKRFEDAAIQRSLAENEGKKTKAMSDLKIDTGLLYKSLRRTGKHGGGKDGE